MGSIYKISCECGYNKELYLGEGLMSCNVDSISTTFSQKKLKRFKYDLDEERVCGFQSEKIAAFCKNCKEILETLKIYIELEDGNKYSLMDECSICGGNVFEINKPYKCPVCGGIMDIKNTGLWD